MVDRLSESELQKLYNMINDLSIDQNVPSKKLPWNRLSEGEQEAIEKGLSQLENGEGKPHQEVMTGFRENYGR